MPQQTIDIKEARDLGLIHEINRQLLHPMGYALFVIEEEGNWRLGGILEDPTDPEGFVFTHLDTKKMEAFATRWEARRPRRKKLLDGQVVQTQDYIFNHAN